MDSLCSEDMQEASVCYCMCKFPLPSFCQYHAEEHKTKSSAFHFLLPPSAFQVITSKDEYLQAKSWLQHLSGNQDVLREKLEEFAKCEEKIEAVYQEVLQLALDSKEKFKQAFSIVKEAFKTAVQGAINETCEHALESQWAASTNALSQLLWFSDPQAIWSRQLYTFQACCANKYIDLAFQVTLSLLIPGLDHLKIGVPSLEEEKGQVKDDEIYQLKAALETERVAALTAKQNKTQLETELQEIKQKLQEAESQLRDLREDSIAKEEQCLYLCNKNESCETQIKQLIDQLEILGKGKQDRSVGKHQTQVNLRPEQQLATISGHFEIFDIVAKQWQYKEMNGVYIDSCSCWTFAGPNQIFGCGASNYSQKANSAWVIESNGDYHPLPKMQIDRIGPGLMYDSETQAVYVFGGGVLKRSCEKFIIPSYQWKQLPDMSLGRYCFNPCRSDSDVYLCGGNKNSVEIYNIQSNTFTLLPDFLLPESENCTAVVESDCIVVVSNNYICRWSLQERRIVSSLQHPEYDPHSNCTPVISGGFIYSTSGVKYSRISIATGVCE